MFALKRDFKTTSTVKCPDFSMCKISPNNGTEEAVRISDSVD
jgi:hypothetical protein